MHARSARCRLGFCIGLILTGLFSFAQLRAQTDAPVVDGALEYRVKAGFLFNFLRFTEWPPEALAPDAIFRIAVLADAAAYAQIATALNGKAVNGHKIEVLALDATSDWTGCHLLFLTRDSGVPASLAVSRLRSAPVLLVGETEAFASSGGTIGFVLRGTNIRFQVNLQAAQTAGLRLSSKLASLAEVVKTP